MDGSTCEFDLSDSWTVIDKGLALDNISSDSENGPSTPKAESPYVNQDYAEDKEEITVSSDEESLEIIPEDRTELNECQDVLPGESDGISVISSESDDDYPNAGVLRTLTVDKGKIYPIPNIYFHLTFVFVLSLATAIGLGLGLGHFFGSEEGCEFSKKPPSSNLLLSLQQENQLLKYHLDQLLTVVRCHHSKVAIYNCISNYVTFLRRPIDKPPGLQDFSKHESMLDHLGSTRDIYSKCVMTGEVNPLHAKAPSSIPLQNEERKSNLENKMVQESLDTIENRSEMCGGPGCFVNQDTLVTEEYKINQQDNSYNKYPTKTEIQFDLNEEDLDNVNKPSSFENVSNKNLRLSEDYTWKVGSNEEEIHLGRRKGTVVQGKPKIVKDIKYNMNNKNKEREIQNHRRDHNKCNSRKCNGWPDKGKIQDKRNVVPSKYFVDENTLNRYKKQTNSKRSNVNSDEDTSNKEHLKSHCAGQKYSEQEKCHQESFKQGNYEKHQESKMGQEKECTKQIDALKLRSKHIEANRNIRRDNTKARSTIKSDHVKQKSNISGEWILARGNGRADFRRGARKSEWWFARAKARHQSRANEDSWQDHHRDWEEKVIHNIRKLNPKNILKNMISLLERIGKNDYISKLRSQYLKRI